MRGTAGQSLGVWNAGGLHLELEGDANDFVGKGMAGGRIVVKPAKNVRYETRDAAIIGNTCLYGATGGTLFAAGMAGERFAVRSEEHTSELQSLMRISYSVFCLKKTTYCKQPLYLSP